MYDDIIRAFANTIKTYTDIHEKCWNATPEECKNMMTMEFPYLQGTHIQLLLKKVSELPYDTQKAGKQLEDYFNNFINQK